MEAELRGADCSAVALAIFFVAFMAIFFMDFFIIFATHANGSDVGAVLLLELQQLERIIAVVGNEPSVNLVRSLANGMKKHVPSLKVETLVVPGTGENFTEVRLSDHSPFWDAGIPAVMVTDTAFFRNPHYHQPSDTVDTLDMDFIRENAEAVTETLKTLLHKKEAA